VNSYISFVSMLLLSFGLVSETPLIIIFLVAVGILDVEKLKKKRGVIIVAIFLISGILTPGPDIFSQVLMAIPLLILFELSLVVARFVKPILSENKGEASISILTKTKDGDENEYFTT
ncbi:MAG: twin-arginine translocase subunit TatC, partial [Oligoflexia bacterium]|nr:twin-arginine translocase subunit TatC [Oligoflexia bacterium]